MLKYGDNNIGKMYFGSNSIGKAYYGSHLVFQKGGGEPSIFTKLDYLETNGSSYTLCPVTYASGNAYAITIDMQFLTQADSGKGTGWNAGGAVAIRNASNASHYSDGSNSDLLPVLNSTNRAFVTISIGTNSQTTVSAVYEGVTSSHTRSSTSLENYAGQTGFPLGCLTGSGGTVPADGTAIRFYSVKIMCGSSKVFDAYPVTSTEATENAQGVTVPSGTVGFYDKVTKKFYTDLSGQGFTPGYLSI